MAQPSHPPLRSPIHSPLTKPTETRLLSVHPGAVQDEICCDLINTDLANPACEYEALSYVWGDDTKPCKIHVGSSREVLAVTANADAALRRLRHADRPRLVWVDAICIDQANIPERNSQVAMMARIYKTAHRVVVDLGKATAEVKTAIAYLEEIARRDPATDVMTPHQEGRPLRACDPSCPAWYSGMQAGEEDRQLFMPAFDHKAVAGAFGKPVWVDEDTPRSVTPRFPTKLEAQSLLRLFEYPWFTRAWVVQEMYHARSVTLLCDPHSFEWVSFDWFLEKWQQARGRMGMTVPRIVSIRNPVKTTKGLWSLLNTLRSCASTDARDKVYAVISMAADAQPDILPIDYAASPASVFTRAAALLFCQVGLNVLWAVRGRSPIEGLPSWAPDWSMASAEADKLFKEQPLDIMRPSRPAGGPPDWAVARLITARKSGIGTAGGIPGLTLKARGVRIGRISWVGEACDPEKGDWKAVVHRWKHVAQLLDIRQYPSARPVDPSLSSAVPPSSSIGLQEHARNVPYPTQANGGYEVIDMDLFPSMLAVGFYKDVDDPQNLRRELEEKNGMDQMWQCKFDADTLFNFRWHKGQGSEFFKDVNAVRKIAPSPGEIFYRTLVGDGASLSGAEWQIGAYHIFGEGLGATGPAPQDRLRVYEEAARHVLAGRRFFVTDEGYVGLAPREAEANDLVVVFLGDMVPSVLRPRTGPSNYDFVGQCYVYGATEGEAVRHIHVSRLLAKIPTSPLEDFVIW